MTETPPVDRKVFNSWKEIAAFLRVTVRTAQRWERDRGLPVHRFGPGSNARIVANSEELTSWVKSQHRKGSSSAPPPRVFSDRSRSQTIRILVVALLLCLAGSISVVWWTRPGPGTNWRIEAESFKVFDDEGRLCWQKTLPGSAPGRTHRRAACLCAG